MRLAYTVTQAVREPVKKADVSLPGGARVSSPRGASSARHFASLAVLVLSLVLFGPGSELLGDDGEPSGSAPAGGDGRDTNGAGSPDAATMDGELPVEFRKSWRADEDYFKKIFKDRELPPLKSKTSGLFVTSVILSQESGLSANDIITRIDGRLIVDDASFDRAMQSLSPGRVVKMGVKRVVRKDKAFEWGSVAVEVRVVSKKEVTEAAARNKAAAEAKQAAEDAKIYRVGIEGAAVPMTRKAIGEYNKLVEDQYMKKVLAASPEERFYFNRGISAMRILEVNFTSKDPKAGYVKTVEMLTKSGRVDDVNRMFSSLNPIGDIIAIDDVGRGASWKDLWSEAQEAFIDSLRD